MIYKYLKIKVKAKFRKLKYQSEKHKVRDCKMRQICYTSVGTKSVTTICINT